MVSLYHKNTEQATPRFYAWILTRSHAVSTRLS